MIKAVVLGSVVKLEPASSYLMLLVYLIQTAMGTPLWKRPAMQESVVSENVFYQAIAYYSKLCFEFEPFISIKYSISLS